jgi:hypothetical protein
LHAAQAEPKINLTDRPILDLEIQIEGYGHSRGKARLMLPRTSRGVSCHAVLSTPMTGRRFVTNDRPANPHPSGAHLKPGDRNKQSSIVGDDSLDSSKIGAISIRIRSEFFSSFFYDLLLTE